MNVHIVDSSGHAHTIKTVKAGETVSSLLSFIDCLTGQFQPFLMHCVSLGLLFCSLCNIGTVKEK